MSNLKFTVYMYEQEKNYIEWLVSQKQDIETGGDLFGLWQNKDMVVVQLALGPGKNCIRTQTSFFQDINYLASAGNELTKCQGLCNIGEWHSHHRIDLPLPSTGDQTTVWNNMKSVTSGRFLLFIATITGSKEKPNVHIGCFMFSLETKEMSKGMLVELKGNSPMRKQFVGTSFKSDPEEGTSWVNFTEAVKNYEISKDVKKDKFKKDKKKRVEENHKIDLGGDLSSGTESKQIKYTRKGHRSKNQEITDKKKLIEQPQNKYGTMAKQEEHIPHNSGKKKRSKNNPRQSGVRRSDEVITAQPGDMHNRRLEVMGSPFPETNTYEEPKKFICC